MQDIMNINGIECFEKDGVAYLKLETVARGLGFTRIADSGNEVVRWERVDKYLKELGFVPTSGHDGFIPENIFYRLAMKAKNEAAEHFQAKIADEVIPSIRKYGAYMTPETLEKVLLSPDTLMQLAQNLKDEQEKRKELVKRNRAGQTKGTVCRIGGSCQNLNPDWRAGKTAQAERHQHRAEPIVPVAAAERVLNPPAGQRLQYANAKGNGNGIV